MKLARTEPVARRAGQALCLALAAILPYLQARAAADNVILAAWPVDAMEKVFRDAAPPSPPVAPAPIDAARNEVVSAQIVVRCTARMDSLSCRAGPLALDGAHAIPPPRVRYVGYVPVNSKSPAYAIRPRPCDYPDPLYEAPTNPVPRQTAQPVWLTLKVPADAPPGIYRGTVEIGAVADGAPRTATVPLSVKVYAARLPDKRSLYVSNWSWFDSPEVARWCGVNEIYSEPFWSLMTEVAKDMAFHRQNVILTPTTAWTWLQNDPVTAKDLVTARADRNGELEFDFSLFDRWVNLFRNAGVDGLVEGGPLSKHAPHSRTYRSVVWVVENGKAVKRTVPSVTPDYERYLAAYLPALQTHLQQRGWLDTYVQHILDEPNAERKPTYVRLAAWVRQYAPRIRIIDATQTTDLVGSIDIWVPTLRHWNHNREFFLAREARGEAVWFYTMTRPVEFPLTRVRLMHWASYQSGVTGYLHWGYNWWVRSSNPNAGRWTLLPGDEWIVYPRPGGVTDSLRFESMLEGLQDYELLKLLAARDAGTADAICRKLVDLDAPDPGRESGDLACRIDDRVESLRAARRELLNALSGTPRKDLRLTPHPR